MGIALRTYVKALLMGSSAAFAAGHAHVHGVAKLDIAVEASSITLQLESPLDNLVGFERAPRTDAERQQANAAVSALRSAAMFSIDPAAQCTPAHVELSSSALQLGHPDPKAEEQGHADIDGSFEFKCVDTSKAAYIDVGLFEFVHLQRLEVRVATPHGQFKRELRRPARRIALTR